MIVDHCRSAEARLAAKRAARAEAREIRLKELERQQKEISDDEERMSVGSRGSLRPSDYGAFLGSSSRASSRASSARASPVVEERADFLEKGSRTASTLSAATLASLGRGFSRRGSCDTSISADTEASIRDMKDSLTEAEDRYRRAMVSNAQLDNEKANLMYQADTLKDMELEEVLYETRRECDEKNKELERERHAHSVLSFQFTEVKETLMQSEVVLKDAHQLHMKQESYVKEIADLKETLEWKEKKIGALKQTEEYSDIVQDERDELRDEVFRLRNALKKHGIALESDVTTNGETSNVINGPEHSKSAQETPTRCGDSKLERPPKDQTSELDCTSRMERKYHIVAPNRIIGATIREENRPPAHEDIILIPEAPCIVARIQKCTQFSTPNKADRESVRAENIPEAFSQRLDQTKDCGLPGTVQETFTSQENGVKTALKNVHKQEKNLETIFYKERGAFSVTKDANRSQMQRPLRPLSKDINKALTSPQISNTEDELNLAATHQENQTNADATEIPGTSKACQGHFSKDFEVSSIKNKDNPLSNDESETELDLKSKDVLRYMIAIPPEEKEMLVDERDSLLEQVRKLKLVADQKQRNGTHEDVSPGDDDLQSNKDPHILDLQRDANRQISDLKFKLVKSDQEVTALEQNIIRLESQVTCYKTASEAAEKVEDELKAEKRKLQRELRSALDRIDELQNSNSHLSKRLEKMKANRSAMLAQQ
ncbi:leucine-rich repeat flightless-interacting protein 2-like [Trichomycterus rosablanca]|uniref:leucine-rich repeat flightless-interacting protein 2-like n=1 Tax=Trichomycterus rosablanca TaxID=2290929 RepID=UPI002F35947F